MAELPAFEALAAYEEAHCFIDHFIRNERLESTLLQALDLSGVPVSDQDKAAVLSRPRTNASSRSHGPEYYYDSHTKRLVLERERLIVEKFGYAPPPLTGA